MPFSVTIDQKACLGRKDCIKVCEERVFGWEKAEGLGMVHKLRLQIESKGYQARVINEQACTGCMDCMQACPEGAIEVSPKD